MILYKRRKINAGKETLNYMKIIDLKVKMKNIVNIITTTMSKDDYTTEIKELGEKELGRLFDRNRTSELKRHFNNIEVMLGTVQELKYKMQELMVSQNEDMGKMMNFRKI